MVTAIKLARVKADMRQTELARLTGLTQSTLSSLENGKQDPTIPTLMKIAKALGVDPGSLLEKVK